MARINEQAIRDFARKARRSIEDGAVEDVLRHLLSVNLPAMFEDNPWWILAHSIGVEARVHYIDAAGRTRRGFVDSLVGKTAIEYEKNLTVRPIFQEGYRQVQEYCAGMLNDGATPEDLFGVLSDTVRWHAYRVELTGPLPSAGYGPGDLKLVEVEQVDLTDTGPGNLRRFGEFIYRYIGRHGARGLAPQALVSDFGFDSDFCIGRIQGMREAVDIAFVENPEYAEMIAGLWMSYVDHLGAEAQRPFDGRAYVNELYMVTLAKLLCANILENRGIVSNDAQLLEILDGSFFQLKGFRNFVEYDYFGWLNTGAYAQLLLPVARELQADLLAYDFTRLHSVDLFGPLVSQLAAKDRRPLLGQEFTPQWLAGKMVSSALAGLKEGEPPHFLDMCCGSGVFLVESVRQTARRMEIAPHSCSAEEVAALAGCVMGFDIDPLAVMMAKASWMQAMREYVHRARGELTIPVYQADSLFASAPIAQSLEDGHRGAVVTMRLDTRTVSLPGYLITPDCRELFDDLVQRCHDVAMVRARSADPLTPVEDEAASLARRLAADAGGRLQEEQLRDLAAGCAQLLVAMEQLEREGKNGIWSFVIANCYRPGLVAGQFNGIVSNPPWMAASKLANNPYKTLLSARAKQYDIYPPGSAHPHLEIATVFLLGAVERYLRRGGVWECVLPDSLLNGKHHEPFRRQQFLEAQRPVELSVEEIWEVPTDTFKNRSVILRGRREAVQNPDVLPGKKVFAHGADRACEYRLVRYQGKRTAWTNDPIVWNVATTALREMPFVQGADLMPRTLIFHQCDRQPNGRWTLSPIDRQRGELGYLVADEKKNAGFALEAHNVDDTFLYQCLLSKHVFPFYVSPPAYGLLPVRTVQGRRTQVDDVEMLRFGRSSAAVFRRIYEAAGCTGLEFFQKRINCHNKLSAQSFEGRTGWLMLAGAGGSYTCAGAVPLEQLEGRRLVVDQTLYWYVASSREEALYIMGILNSPALDRIISALQTVGLLGRRHVHKLPYMATPAFEPGNPLHMLVACRTDELIRQLQDAVGPGEAMERFCGPQAVTLSVGRRKVRERLQQLPAYEAYVEACRTLYSEVHGVQFPQDKPDHIDLRSILLTREDES